MTQKKYAKITDKTTKSVQIGVGVNPDFYKSIGMELMEVEQAESGQWYLAGYCPAKAPVSAEEKVAQLEGKYNLPRPVRTALLALEAQNASLDNKLLERIKEIEALAMPLREGHK